MQQNLIGLSSGRGEIPHRRWWRWIYLLSPRALQGRIWWDSKSRQYSLDGRRWRFGYVRKKDFFERLL